MGRFLLLLVAGASLSAILYGSTSNDASTTAASRQGSSEEALLARVAAQGAFDAALAALVADFGARPSVSERPVDAGSSASGRQSATTTETPLGSVRLLAGGRYGPAQHRIEAEAMELLPMGAGIVVHAEKAEIQLKDLSKVSGHDERVTGAGMNAGLAPSRPGIGFSDPAVQAATTGAWGASGTHTVGSSGVGGAEGLARIQLLVDEILSAGTATTVASYNLKSQTAGSPLAPVVIHATKDAKLEGTAVGYGILIVDGNLEFKDTARWEGLVIVRATSSKEREIKIQGDASIYGGLALLGQEFTQESGGDAGFPGGHMDLDIFSGTGMPLSREYHKHEWDDAYNLTYLDFFTAPDLSPSFNAFRQSHAASSLRVQFVNTRNAAGTYSIGSAAALATGRIEDGFDAVVPFSTLATFRVDFKALCTLRGTNPGLVKGDGVNRDGAFTVRFWNGTKLIYAVSAYEHAKTLREGSPTCGSSGGSPVADAGIYGKFKLTVENNGSVRRSEETMGRSGRTVPSVRSRSRVLPWFVRSVPVGR